MAVSDGPRPRTHAHATTHLKSLPTIPQNTWPVATPAHTCILPPTSLSTSAPAHAVVCDRAVIDPAPPALDADAASSAHELSLPVSSS